MVTNAQKKVNNWQHQQ